MNKLCYNCSKSHDEIVVYEIKDRNYLSNFDSMDTVIQLCPHCNKELEVEPHWFDNNECFEEGSNGYLYEQYIINLIETFSLENQEYILNDPSDNMTREEWIEFHS